MAMAPYPVLQQQIHLGHASKPTATASVHHHGHGNPNADAVAPSLRRSFPADARGLRALIKVLPTSSASAAVAVHAHATKLGLDRERTVRNGLIALYLACGERAAATALFDAFPGDGPDVVSWTAMVTGHARLGFTRDAVALFFAMLDLDDGVSVDAVAAAAGFAACAEARDLALSREAHRRVAAARVALDVVAWNALVDMYAKCGDVAAARQWFRRMPVAKTVVSWNTMLAALARAGEHGEALALFREMQRAGVRPDGATFVAVLGACAQLGALDTGRWVHAYMRRQPERDADAVVVSNALLDMYAKCGAVDQAAAVFDGMARRDVYTYASMIAGLATHGRAEEALALFAAMRRAGGVRPNGVVLLGVLSACCHAGLVDEGLRHLGAMEDAYGVAPGVEHYGCAVDMLGRAGRLDEAEALVAAMPVPPDALVRGSLLAACRACGDVERAERVMRWMAAVDRDGEAGDHVLMSNMYASEGRHVRALQLRKQMRKSKIVKDPGCSSIEIDGVVHEFRAVPANAIA
ncbi:hypothetical protein BDA96_10G013900 [Sorghum bicolor]|uniref:Pentacotripeptide-repeat region of PRORP domain-containing protein n=2 Tax=Sorghum bicolor TaxID=4558 RepID=A0A921Q0W1_SORBI|nr:pentatricopeptide repeat-containing protein At1g08070, chloroplastic [Sorghum bicolor]KAG0512445.1 hypothetical protein BDA96_10G013900 [Sorghum bicolor]|eukprot:XP_002436366.1 pentatricopeptide repeat-containing protein At1g08070, chloroplastic [Sorghum bicolor]